MVARIFPISTEGVAWEHSDLTAMPEPPSDQRRPVDCPAARTRASINDRDAAGHHFLGDSKKLLEKHASECHCAGQQTVEGLGKTLLETETAQ